MNILKACVRVLAGLAIVAGPTVTTLHTTPPRTSSAPAMELSAGPVYDLPVPPLSDTFPANTLLEWLHAHGDPTAQLTDVQQCGVFALWWVDNSRNAEPYTELSKLNRIWNAVHPTSHGVPAGWIDDAAELIHVGVDGTPHVGAIGIYQPNTNGAGANGHAFIVAGIDTIHREVRITEYNWSPHRWGTRVVPYGVSNLVFVHFTLTGP